MKSRMLTTICLLGMLLSVPAGNAALAQTKSKSQTGKQENVIVLKATKSTTRGQEDPNVKNDKETNDQSAQMPAPVQKGGAKTRGVLCEVHFDNRTPWIIKLFVNGGYQGAIAPYGDAVAFAPPGNGTVVYGRADFVDGSALNWGPTSYDFCGYNRNIYFRMDP